MQILGSSVSNSQRWLAPELCFDKGRLTMAADIYAFGMTMLEACQFFRYRVRLLLTFHVANDACNALGDH